MNFSKSYSNLISLIGNTKIIRLNRVIPSGYAAVWAKLEQFNPSGSVKDRICIKIIEEAEKSGLIKPGIHTIVEATSGNTGIGLAMICKIKGYKLILTMPDDVSYETIQVLKTYETEIVLTPAKDSIEGSIKRSWEIASETKDSFIPNQFENPNNPESHETTTALELLEQIPGDIHALVLSVNTGGSISGIGKVLKHKYPDIRIYVVEPQESAVLSGQKPQKHNIKGIGPGFIPKVLNTEIYDDILKIKSDEAKSFTRELATKEGLLVGISSGAVAKAAKMVAEKLGRSKNVATIFSDSGQRYLSTDLFDMFQ